MKLENYELHLPSYSVGKEVYNQIGKICKPYGAKVLVIGGKKALSAAFDKISKNAADGGLDIIGKEIYGTDCTYEAVERLAALTSFQEADMVFAVGGGKAIDTCKCLCIECEKPVFTFSTIASNCAACTSVSIMYHEDGTFFKPHFFTHPAAHAFIDTQIIAAAPYRYLWAGIGDTYAKNYEAEISSRGEKLPHYTEAGVGFSKMCLTPMLEYGRQALEDNKKGVATEALEQVALAIVVTTAIVSIFLTRDFTPDYNSGLAHACFYALTAYPVIEKEHLHGEVVGFGVLYALLVDGQQEEFEKIYALNKELGLPVRIADIGITEEQFFETMDRIPQMSDIRHYPYVVTKEMLMQAYETIEQLPV